MTKARKYQVSVEDTPYYHVTRLAVYADLSFAAKTNSPGNTMSIAANGSSSTMKYATNKY